MVCDFQPACALSAHHGRSTRGGTSMIGFSVVLSGANGIATTVAGHLSALVYEPHSIRDHPQLAAACTCATLIRFTVTTTSENVLR